MQSVSESEHILFNRNTFGKVAGLVDRTATAERRVVGEELHRNYFKHRGEQINCLRNYNIRIGIGDRNYSAVSCLDLVDIGNRFAFNLIKAAERNVRLSLSISDIVPCFSSPAAYASQGIYEISFNFSDASIAVQ